MDREKGGLGIFASIGTGFGVATAFAFLSGYPVVGIGTAIATFVSAALAWRAVQRRRMMRGN